MSDDGPEPSFDDLAERSHGLPGMTSKTPLDRYARDTAGVAVEGWADGAAFVTMALEIGAPSPVTLTMSAEEAREVAAQLTLEAAAAEAAVDGPDADSDGATDEEVAAAVGGADHA